MFVTPNAPTGAEPRVGEPLRPLRSVWVRALARIGRWLTQVPLDFDAQLAAAQVAVEARNDNADSILGRAE